MKKKTAAAPASAPLRRRAEDEVRQRQGKAERRMVHPPADPGMQRVLHELQVHQIELEMQNAELCHIRDELEAALAKYTELYDFAPAGYFTLDAEGMVQQVNLPGARQVGLDRSRVKGTAYERYLAGGARPEFKTFMARVFAGGGMCEEIFGTSGLWNAGVKFVRIRAQAAPDGSTCSLIVSDVTEWKEAEDNLRHSEIRYRRLFEAAQDGVLLVDPDTGKITDANPFLTKLLGYPHGYFVGRELHEIGLLRNEAEKREMMLKMNRDSRIHYGHVALRNKSGQQVDVEAVANLYQEGGRAVIQCNIRDITARKQAQDALWESEWRLRYAAESARLTFVELNYSTGTVRPADNFLQVLGFTPPLPGLPDLTRLFAEMLLAKVMPGDRLRVGIGLEQIIHKQALAKLDFRVVGDDGKERWIESRWTTEKNADGRMMKIFATYLDVTERMLATSALRLSEERYRTLFESMDEGYCILDMIFDADGKAVDWWFLEVNPSFEQHTGIKKAAGKRVLELVQGHEKEWFEIYGKVALTGEPLRFIKQAEAMSQRWFELYAFRVGGEDSRKVAVLFTDISARVKTEGDLVEKARLLDLSHDAIIVRDMEGHIRYWNHGAEELYGWSRQESLGKISHKLLRTEFSVPVDIMLEELLRTGRWTGELVHKKRNGRKVTVLVRKTLDRDAEGTPLAVMENITDFSERKAAEMLQRKLEVVTATNRKLEQEITRRQAVEKSLKTSEQEQRRLLKQAQQQQVQLRRLSHQILEAQEEERKRISRELHDVIAQTLVGISVHVSTLASPGQDNKFLQKIERTRLMVEQSVNRVHQFARELRPPMLDDLGLIPALQSSMQAFMEETGVRASLQASAGVEHCPEDLRTVIYRVTQEALANVARHAQATHVEIRLLYADGGLTLEIQDDGRGFAVEGKPGEKKSPRLGLMGMRERIEMVGGTLLLTSAPGLATTVRAAFPLPALPALKGLPWGISKTLRRPAP